MADTGSPPSDWGQFYGELFSRRVDLVGDYAGSETFLIDGDSLLLHCFSDDKLDFHHGFQMLHAVWLVERFLDGLRHRNCHFHLAFFDNRAQLCVPSHASAGQRAKFLLARAVVLRHLEASLDPESSPIRVLVFPSITDSAFTAALAENGYIFVMMNDGAADDCDCPDHARDKAALRLAICSFITRGCNVALINGLEWSDTKVITAIIEGTARGVSVAQPALEQLSAAIDSDQDPRATSPDTQPHDTLTKLRETVQHKLSERLYLVAATTGILLSTNAVPANAVASFLAHAALQGQIRLGYRSANVPSDTELSEEFLVKFSKVAKDIMRSSSWRAFIGEACAPCDIADLVDGRLYSALLSKNGSGWGLDEASKRVLASLMDIVVLIAGSQPFQQDYLSQVDAHHVDGVSTQQAAPYSKLLPFSESVFEKHLKPIKLDVDKDAVQRLTNNNSKTFRELAHWRNSKRPFNRKVGFAAKERAAFLARRRDQRFMAEMMAYAASLTNAVGKTLEPETIILQGDKAAPVPKPANENQKPRQTAKANAGKSKQPSKKQIMMDKIAADSEKKNALSASKVVNSWQIVCQDIERAPDVSVRHSKALQYLNNLQSSKQDAVNADVEMYALNCLLLIWQSSITNSPKSPNFGIAARIWDCVGRLRNMPGITKTMALRLQNTVNALGLPFTIAETTTPDRKLTFTFALSSNKTTGLTIPLASKEFQLLHCGPYFDRKMDSAPDHRVPFLPDGWQRKVLDVVDSEKSLFVVAPTSAGKTFISFYAMKKVLEGSNDGVLVYIAPTKALVNQIAAEIQARFSKSYKHAGKSVWGIHTRDYRVNNATGCQVLVTVPHILQVMLLAPANADSWSARIKRIIFDEVHCIGQAEDGIVWEQLLMLAPCPIIALSATVGNPQQFHSWLASAQKAIGNELVMVHHPHRYSDLRKFVYSPPKKFSFAGLPKSSIIPAVGLDNGAGFTFVHPVASLLNRSRGMPEDFSLEARDCYTLWQSMKRHATDTHAVDKSLDPNSALPAIITQADIINWSQSLKRLLLQWMGDHNSPFDDVVRDLGQELPGIEADNGASCDDLVPTVLPLLCQLHEQSALPAILFNYDRSDCENICRTVLSELKDSEKQWKESSPVWEKKMAAWESWKKSSKTKKATGKKTAGLQADGMGKADLEREAASADVDSWESFDPNAPIDGFHFMDRSKLQASELDEYAKELEWRNVPSWLIEALYRGIAVHHAGMNRKYRHVVELLFRKGYLRVVVATGTLALGINMPCKTVVFCGDSVFLTALNFRQAAGRAGRRGFDVLGNVVFHGVPIAKVHRLLSSRLPDLTGHFAITTTLVLRLCSLLHESKHAAFSIRSVDALLSQPRLYLGGDESRLTVLHHLRFSLEYLRRQFLLDQSGAPLNFAPCVSHLYYTESSNFAFHALLKEGYFHQLCAGIRQNPETSERILRTLMLVLSHIFGRQYCRQVDREFVENVVKQSPSCVLLPALPEDAAAILHQHNRETLDVFSTYARTYVEQHLEEDDSSLPLTGIKFGGSGGAPGVTIPTIRSHFVALSGHGDDFESISELCHTVRSGVFLEEAVIPHIPVESELPLNAYLFDFFKHGDVTALDEANGIRRGDVWFVLNDFSMILATIIASLTNFIKQNAEDASDILDAVGRGDAHEEEVEDNMIEAPAVDPKPLPVLPKKTRKKEVSDNWDDDLDDGADDGGDSNGPDANGDSFATDGHGQDQKTAAWEAGADGTLLDVLEGFKKLSDEFNEKFKAMWA